MPLIRLAQALAKMRLSDGVLASDVDEAIRLMKVPSPPPLSNLSFSHAYITHQFPPSPWAAPSPRWPQKPPPPTRAPALLPLASPSLSPLPLDRSLPQVATQTAATDPRTGTIDMDMITTGRSAVDKEAVARVTDELRLLFAANGGRNLTVGQLRMMLQQHANQHGQGQGRHGGSGGAR